MVSLNKMLVSEVHLANFRNFKKRTFSFSPNITIIIGPNASGKTNILESLHLLSTGKSFRVRVEEEMISYDKEIARVYGQIVGSRQHETTKLEVVLTRGEITIGEDPNKKEKSPRKRLLINGAGKRLFNYAGSFRVVLFSPDDLDLVTESPSVRRNFLDTVLSQVDREYRRASLSYEKGLRQRNRLLFRIREEGLSRGQLVFWNRLLIKNGDYMASARQNFIDFANEQGGLNGQAFSLEYDKSAISQARLDQYKNEEVAAAATLVGPHRDDFIFRIHSKRNGGRGKRDLARYGSRGEQRMGTLWLKMAELSFIKQETKEKPALLLDDIFSELDHEHREVVMQAVVGQQTIITTADPHFVEGFKKMKKIELE
jgi:DNA replication and repair protein RecF